MRRIETLAALVACACLSAALSACAAAPVVSEKPDAAPATKSAPAPLHPDVKEVEGAADAPLHAGKEEVTVLVLNGCGIEGAAEEAAAKLRADGFEQVTVDNASYYDYPRMRVSYRYESQQTEVDRIAELLDVGDAPGDVYCYGEDAKDWGKEYDILVMVGGPDSVGLGSSRS